MGRFGTLGPGGADDSGNGPRQLVGEVSSFDDAGQLFVRDESGRERPVDSDTEVALQDRGRILVFRKTDRDSGLQPLREVLQRVPAPEGFSLVGGIRDTGLGLLNIMEAGRTATRPENIRPADALAVPIAGTAIGMVTRSVPRGALGAFGSRFNRNAGPDNILKSRSKIAPEFSKEISSDGAIYTAKIDDKTEVTVDFFKGGGRRPGGEAEIEFAVNDDILITNDPKRKPNPNVMKVLGVVQNALIDAVVDTRPDTISFTGATPALREIYREMLPRLANGFGGEWRIVERSGAGPKFILDLSKSRFRKE